jgi:hypothetical protein
MIKRTIVCDCCGKQETEAQPGGGWVGWVSMQGVVLNGAENPNFCPTCKVTIMNFIDRLAGKENDMG